MTVWAGLGVVATALTFWGVASAVVPSLTDPSKTLTRVAKNFLAGPKNPEHAKQLKTEFDNSVKEFLLANGKAPSPELIKKLQEILASDSFEVHTFDLPRGIRVVEIDTLLQASDFIVMSANNNVKVTSLPDFEVFDSAQILNDHARNNLVLVGHSAGQSAHKPEVKVFALLPDDLVDETGKAIPSIVGEGTAAFAPNHKDIIVDLNLFSVGVAQGLFKPQQISIGRGEEERVKQYLTWSDGRYTSKQNAGKGAFGALYTVARCMQNPADIDKYSDSLSSKALQFLKSAQIKIDNPNFVIGQTEAAAKQKRTPTVSRLLNASNGASYRVEMQKSSNNDDAHVIVSNIKNTNEAVVASKPVKTPPNTVATNSSGQSTGQQNSSIQVATTDPALMHHQATIVEKKPSSKVEQKNDISIEDRIINSTKPQPQTAIKPGKEEPAKPAIKEQPPKTAEKPVEQKPVEQAGVTTDPNKVQIVENKNKSGRYPVDQLFSPSLEKTVDGNINLRKGPSDGYRTLSHLKSGNKVEIIGKKGSWYKVRSGGTEGFIAMSAIDKKTAANINDGNKNASATKPESAASAVSNSKPTTANNNKSTITTTAKETKPSTTAANTTKDTKSSATATASNKQSSSASSSKSKDSKATKSETVTATKTDTSKEKSKETKESTPIKTASKPEKSSESGKSSKPKDTTEPMHKGLTTGTLNRNRTIRDENHNAIGSATKGEKVVVLTGLKNGKYKVQLPSGKTGYVDKDTVDVVNDAPQFVP
ncbi:MAG TPA: SH3 domain-containing protein [Drouetiella sp.]